MTSTELANVASSGLMALYDSVPDVAADMMADLGVNGGPQFKFDGRTGHYFLDGQPVPHGTELAFNFFETKKGLTCFKDGGVVESFEEKTFGGKRLPAQSDLNDHSPYAEGEGWKPTITFMVRFLHNGQQCQLRFASYGGVTNGSKLFAKWHTEQRANVDENGEALIPIISISAEKKQGKAATYFVPIFNIEAWMSAEELMADLSGEAVEEAPKKKPAAAAAAKTPARIPGRTGGLGSGVRGARG